jgi:hypothetical protein
MRAGGVESEILTTKVVQADVRNNSLPAGLWPFALRRYLVSTTTTTTTTTTTVNPLTGIETKCFLGFSAWVQVFRVDGFGLRLRVNCFVLKV